MLTSSFLSIFRGFALDFKGEHRPHCETLSSFGYVLMHRAHGAVCRYLLSPGAVSQSEVTAPPKTKQTLVPAPRWPPPTSPGLSQTKHLRNELEGC